MEKPTQGLGNYHLITEDQGKFTRRLVAALVRSERPTITQLQNYLPALGLPAIGVEFALFWVSDEDTKMKCPVLYASVSMLMKWNDYNLAKTTGETFVAYLNRVSSAPDTGALEETVTVDVLLYALNRADLSPEETRKLVVMPPSDNPVEYEQLVTRPGEVFMLLLYVEKHLSYHFVSRHPDVIRSLDELSLVQSEGRLSREWFDDWWSRSEPIQIKLVAQNSDKSFSGLVKELEKETLGSLPNNFRNDGISNLEELADIRNTIGHSTIYNSMVVDGKRLIMPHVTKHTDRPNRQTLATHFDDEVYDLIKSMIEDAHEFLEVCARVPPQENR